jgi:hypothetical protein
LAFIPKGVLERSRKICFNFLWGGRHDNPGIHLAKWIDIANPKDMGGWGLQHIHLFGKSLETKSLWNLLTKDSFWKQVIEHKYIAPGKFMDWKRNPAKSIKKCLIGGRIWS